MEQILLFSEKANIVFSPEYKEIIRQTPHVRYKTPATVWILLLVLLLVPLARIVRRAPDRRRLRGFYTF